MNKLNVPNSHPFHLDSGALRTFFVQLSNALAMASLSGGVVPPPRDKAAEATANGLRFVINAVQRRSTKAGNDWIEPDSYLADKIRTVTTELRVKYRKRTEEELGSKKIELLRCLLTHSVPDILDVLGKLDDENSHSDLIRWLLDPRKANSIAPAALNALVSRLKRPAEWQSLIAAAINDRALSVRRERAFSLDDSDEESQGRFDLLISGPGLRLVIENKVSSDEHDNQTDLYWEWLNRQPGLKAGMILSPIGFPAQNQHFEALSYLDLLNCLLEGPIKNPVDSFEEAVLASFVKTLAKGILRQEFTIINTMKGDI